MRAFKILDFLLILSHFRGIWEDNAWNVESTSSNCVKSTWNQFFMIKYAKILFLGAKDIIWWPYWMIFLDVKPLYHYSHRILVLTARRVALQAKATRQGCRVHCWCFTPWGAYTACCRTVSVVFSVVSVGFTHAMYTHAQSESFTAPLVLFVICLSFHTLWNFSLSTDPHAH